MATAQVDAGYNGNVSRNNFKEVIAQRDDLVVIDGGRMVPPAQNTVYNAGQVMAQFTSGANAGLWAPYNSANSGASDGSQVPAGILYGGADVGANGDGSEIRVITKGIVFMDLCISLVAGTPTAGLTSAIQTAMGGKKKVVHGQNLYSF